jgi:hypothetical protein
MKNLFLMLAASTLGCGGGPAIAHTFIAICVDPAQAGNPNAPGNLAPFQADLATPCTRIDTRGGELPTIDRVPSIKADERDRIQSAADSSCRSANLTAVKVFYEGCEQIPTPIAGNR